MSSQQKKSYKTRQAAFQGQKLALQLSFVSSKFCWLVHSSAQLRKLSPPPRVPLPVLRRPTTFSLVFTVCGIFCLNLQKVYSF